MTPRLHGNKKPRTWRGIVGVRLFCREIDSDYSTPPAFPFQVLYSFQPRFHGIRLPGRKYKSETELDSKSRVSISIAVAVRRNHTRIAIYLAVVNPACMTPITIKCSVVMIKFANIVAKLAANSSLFVVSMMMMMMLIRLYSRWSYKH